MNSVSIVRWTLSGVLIAAAAAAVVYTVAWLIHTPRRQWIPHRPPRQSPWGFLEVILAIGAMVIIPAIIMLVLIPARFFTSLYGTNPDPSQPDVLQRAGVWATVLAAPFVLMFTLAMIRWITQSRVGYVGWRLNGSGPAAARGVAVWLIVTPGVFAIHFAVSYFQEHFLNWTPNKHALEQILEKQALPVEWILVTLLAVVAAPFQEELVFRGLLQPWAAKHRYGCYVVLAMALLVGLAHYSPVAKIESPPIKAQVDPFLAAAGPTTATPGRTSAVWESLAPALFVVATALITLITDLLTRGPYRRWPAIVAASSLFAVMHAAAWPAPIPLFVLSLALGWLMERTRHLLAPLVVHSLFNGVSTLALLLGWAS